MKKSSKNIIPLKTIAQIQNIPIWLLPLLLVFTVIIFSPALKNEFIKTWDDGVYVTDNYLTAQLNSENIKTIFTKPLANNYNPLPIFTFALIRTVADLNPLPYHLVNILFHLLCVSLVFWLTRLLDKRLFPLIIVTLLFAIHPMRVESVVWITELKDVMFASFYFAALITYIYWQRNNRKKFLLLLLMIIFAVLSLLSKIQAVSLPLSMLAIDLIEKRKWSLTIITEKIPFFVLSAATGLLGLYFLKQGGSLVVNEKFPLYERILWAFYAFGNYLVKLVIPFNLSAYYPYPDKENGMLPMMYYLVPVILIAAAIILFKKYRLNSRVVGGVVFFIVNIIFVLQVVGAGKAYMADRFTYVAYFGLFFIAAGVIQDLTVKYKNASNVIKGLFYGYIFFLSVVCWQRILVWKNSETLWSDCIKKYPKAYVAYDNRGVYYRSVKKNDMALNDYSKVLELNPAYPLTYNNRGNIYFESGQDELALADYNKAVALDSSDVRVFTNRALIYFRKKQFEKTEHDFAKAIELDSTFDMIYFNRGLYYDLTNQNEKAIADYEHYLKMNPAHDGIINSMAVSYQKLAKFDTSIIYFTKAISINPKQPVYWQNRSYSENALSQMDKAKADIVVAMELGLKPDAAYLKHVGVNQ